MIKVDQQVHSITKRTTVRKIELTEDQVLDALIEWASFRYDFATDFTEASIDIAYDGFCRSAEIRETITEVNEDDGRQ